MQFVPRNFYPNPLLVFIFTLLLLIVPASAEPPHHSDAFLREETARNIAADVTGGEDPEIRRAAVEALGSAAGTVVVMNARTGRIYTIVNQKWAIETGFKPCSTIKLVTGIAGYNENLINRNGTLARGVYRLGLNDALAYSNNPFFQKVGAGLGSEKMIHYARRLGLGEITGINADNEYAGTLPYGNENPRIYSHADDFLVTPLQLSVMVSAITNGGRLLIPQIPRSRREQVRFKGAFRDTVGLDPEVYQRVIPGMKGAVEYGTAGRISNDGLDIAGKTGSCISQKTWVGLFASVAPVNDPKYSVVVITRGRYARGKHSAAIAEKVYRALRPRYGERFDRNLARRTVTVRSAPKMPDETTARRGPSAEQPAEPAPKPRTVAGAGEPVRSTVITYKRDAEENDAAPPPPRTVEKKDPKKLFPTIIIDGKTELTRPRVVGNQ